MAIPWDQRVKSLGEFNDEGYRTCPNCGKLYDPDNPKQGYCTQLCRRQAKEKRK